MIIVKSCSKLKPVVQAEKFTDKFSQAFAAAKCHVWYRVMWDSSNSKESNLYYKVTHSSYIMVTNVGGQLHMSTTPASGERPCKFVELPNATLVTGEA